MLGAGPGAALASIPRSYCCRGRSAFVLELDSNARGGGPTDPCS